MKADVVVDLQYGSTAKGKLAAFLAKSNQYDASIRVQSIQAGHTVYYNDEIFRMRTIPCAWVNPKVKLILGAGIFIKKELLLEEIEKINQITGNDTKERLYIDYRANYIIDEDSQFEAKNKLTKKIGSTGEGAGASLIRKLWRKSKPTRICDDNWAIENGFKVLDTVKFMNEECKNVLVEGCQGTLLSIHTTPHYPFCTSRECTACGILSECGIAPADVRHVYGVMRTYPIRVGGNSGDTGAKELSWEEIANRSGNKNLVPEKTTVTNRDRRIFEFDNQELEHAILLNKPDKYFLTFLDYINYQDYGKSEYESLSQKTKDFVEKIENDLNIQINLLSTGEQLSHIITK